MILFVISTWGSPTLSPLDGTKGIFIFHTPKSVISNSMEDRLLDGADRPQGENNKSPSGPVKRSDLSWLRRRQTWA